jgi:L-ascorbate metabolism protein UlaG (beta-lactamase superfamily)
VVDYRDHVAESDHSTSVTLHLMRITYLGHASALIELDGVKVITDPLLRPRLMRVLRRVAPAPTTEQLTGIDLVLLSHAHRDHLDAPSLRMLDGEPRVAYPGPARSVVDAAGYPAELMRAGDTVEAGEVVVEAVHADHDGRRMPWNRDGTALGYIVRGPSGSVYFAGDTAVFEGMSAFAPVDAALLPVSGWGPRLPAGHMGPEEAIEAVKLIAPRVAIPIHWGTYERLAMRPDSEREGRARRFVDQVAAVSPGVRAELLAPGSSIELGAGAEASSSA